jgi:dephospho-CoA kinase
VSAAEEVRIERLLKRGMSLTQIKQRLQAQSNDVQREEIADSIIRNEGNQAGLLSEVEKVWEFLQLKNKNKS